MKRIEICIDIYSPFSLNTQQINFIPIKNRRNTKQLRFTFMLVSIVTSHVEYLKAINGLVVAAEFINLCYA